MKLDEMAKVCLDYGADKATVIDVEQIVFDEGLRSYCEANYCGSYGKNYACPPAIGDVQNVIEEAKGYKKALVFQTIHKLEDSYDFEGMENGANIHSKVAEKIDKHLRDIYTDLIQLTAGSCTICKVCSLIEGKPCRFPDRAVSSLEAYCINVPSLAKACNMNYINGANTVTYFGAFLLK